MLGTFEKARRVLDLYSTRYPEWGVTEVARRLEIPASSAHLLMTSLTHMGLLHRTVAGRYRLGFKLLALSQILLSNTPWRDVSREVLSAAAQRHAEALHVAAFDGGQVVVVARGAGPYADSVILPDVGAVLPALESASGRLLLAHRPWNVVKRVLMEADLKEGRAEETLQALEQVLQDGYSVYDAGPSWSAAAGVRNHNGEVIAAVCVSVPVARHAEQRAALPQIVLGIGHEISERLGFFSAAGAEDQAVWTSVQGEERLTVRPRRDG
ncbi:DNA-binding IclR family transcriptional regulator [Deinococcus metalli]|uniref:IclR family transcriptional regulator n=1 Tax=Deinococcus metalli TaxID=1141878 RepID=A0A7W8NPH4_9DEIO|nr:IclR family transcriptional regulator [Deinococcus metalli]MBB5376791.1 DNA-binding IclR family transcriptional regulator [Deinococcus metalli]GHF45371.1 IclR family transcriptional regulator [Deinococcus metalli]